MKLNNSNKSSFSRLWIWLILIVLLVLLFFVRNHFFNKLNGNQINFSFDAESIIDGNFILNGDVFNNVKCQSSEDAYKGKYSCKCDQSTKYGMTKTTDLIQKGDQIKLDLKYKYDEGSARLVIESTTNDFYFSKPIPFNTNWSTFSEEIHIPHNYLKGETKIYAFLESDKGAVYFDDFNINITRNKRTEPKIHNGSEFNIRLTSANYQKIASKRREAINAGLLFSSKNDLVDAFIKVDKKEYGAKVRLKGDLLDHLQGDKWSFRVQLKGNETWNNMSTFSIHNSQARSHVAEWIMHQLFRDEGIITPAYDFIDVKLNDNRLGAYAYEQHFDNNLLKINKRNIGPILRHVDDAYWDNVNDQLSPFPWSEATQIDVYNKENWKDENFKSLFQIGQSMLKDFLDNKKSASQVFDIDKIAKYYALIEISHATHAQQLTNIRFYLDPINGLLEPIGFDCFGDHLPNVKASWTAVGEGMSFQDPTVKTEYDRANTYNLKLFQDKKFYAKYIQYLEQFTSTKYLDNKANQYKKEITNRVNFIKSDKTYKDYDYNWNAIFKKAKFTSDKIYPRSNLGLQAFRVNNSKSSIDVMSYHYFPIKILGFGDDLQLIEPLKDPLIIEGYNSERAIKKHNLRAQNDVAYIYYQTLGLDSLFKIKLSKNSIPTENVALAEPNFDALEKLNFINISENEIYIRSGRHTINQTIVIPSSHKLIINAGAFLEFKNGSSIISKGTVSAIGSQKQPITFFGNNEGSILISNTDTKSIFNNCIFNGLGNLQFRNFVSNSSLTFNNVEVEIEKCYFKNIQSKTSLLSQNSKLKILNSQFDNCKAGIKSEYSNLEAKYNTLNTINNNAFSIKAGRAKIENTKISNVFGIAINGVDNASIYCYDITVSDSEKVVYAKSHAQLDINKANLKNISSGFEVFTKEAPHTSVVIKNLKKEAVKSLYIVQPLARLTIDGQKKSTR